LGAFPNGKVFLFDIDDCQKVIPHNWYFDTRGYVSACIDQMQIRMHRYLMDVPDGIDIDHIKGVRTDNRKSNLRFATQTENRRNKRVRKDSISGVKGVYFDKRYNKYRAGIRIDGRPTHLGHFNTLLEASEKYDEAAIHYFGEFAWLNNLREKTLEAKIPVFFCCPSPKKYHGETLDSLCVLA